MSSSVSSIYTHYGQDPNNHPDQKEISSIVDKMHKLSLGRVALGSDGVLRSLSSENEVIDAVGLPPRLIKAFMDRFPYYEEIEARFHNSDGTLVPQEQWWAPDPSILPQPFTDEENDEARRHYEKNKDIIEEMQQKRKNGEIQGCGSDPEF
ncbi:conserved hypothetical protein [Talaromyces stipitatus ATCC 10500]|uniref:Uncharacterized protein n=1 Tax=Talaromyces stipitatus (strain ATCC 10500 / CBS 375.48 / QM 6759 / NRRL 1006) TaxID=441959 RepID=B8M3H1_TALSN|nr:uncharacterized protein TSTA_095920 [Talaromyces stipitatus ATCC 10500]EED22343.1 conserved hypothetical protein [Talaromyces stipitatus ATCC 10500]